MSDVTQEIVGWLHQQQDWLQEAAEHVVTSGGVSDAEIDHFVSRLMSKEGRAVTTNRTFEALNATAVVSSELRLRSIGDITGIENLAPDRPLKFGNGNLVVVYGPNGSGKSGYTRIIKNACGVPSAQPLESNVFEAPPAAQKCSVGYSIGDDERTVEWQVSDSAVAEMRAVDIFDADAANAYLCEETEPTYTPRILALFRGMALCCNRVKAKLDDKRTHLVSSLPGLPVSYTGTAAGKSYQQLHPRISEAELSSLVEWTTVDQATLDQLTERLRAGDPAAVAKQRRATKVQLDRLVKEMEGAGAILSETWLQALRTARISAQQKRWIAIETAEACSESAELTGIGTDTWRAMWHAAREYSGIPYPDQDFPVTTVGSRCVLCHQELSGDAKKRLHDFEAYVQGKAEAEAKSAEEDYFNLLSAVPVVPSDGDFLSRCEAVGITMEPHRTAVTSFWSSMRDASDKLKSGEPESEVAAVPLPFEFMRDLKAKSVALEREAQKYDEDAATGNRMLAQRQKHELDARKWVSQQAEAIRLEVTRLKQTAILEKLASFANSRQISIKAGEIAEKVITNAYIQRFNAELKVLGAERIQVELEKTHTERGRAKHRIVLKGTRLPDAMPGTVLSDGERRIVALAAFLADVADKPYASPFVFDDPISSLDSDYEGHVAARLCRLAQKRQVLIFTHRLSLYGAMEGAAEKQGAAWCKDNLEKRHIVSFDGHSGFPSDEQVWSAPSTGGANDLLLRQLETAVKAGKAGDVDAYRRHARGICSDFRILVERTIEEDLLNKVVLRHRRSVTTNNRLDALSRIDPRDCAYFDKLMTKYSCYEHSQSPETSVCIPEPAELRADLEELKQWRSEFKKRSVDRAHTISLG